jgi:predicted O-linked N-acetylglucosamine transferase (SPINDLY family)
LLKRVDLADLIAADGARYVSAACRLAADLPGLDQLRTVLRNRLIASPLLDRDGYARALEAAYRAAWDAASARHQRLHMAP